MKITEKLQKAEREGRTFWSFEFFPPRTAQVSAAVIAVCCVMQSKKHADQICAHMLPRSVLLKETVLLVSKSLIAAVGSAKPV